MVSRTYSEVKLCILPETEHCVCLEADVTSTGGLYPDHAVQWT